MKNLDRSAYAAGAENWNQEGLSKREYACIHLCIPESGDEELDAIIRKAQKRDVAIKIMNGILSTEGCYNSNEILSKESLEQAESLLKEI